MSIHTPLGAAPDAGSFELGAATLERRSARERQRLSARARAGYLALGGLTGCAVAISIAAANTDALLPESVRPIPSSLAGPFAAAHLTLGTVPLIALLVAMFGCYAYVAGVADRLSGRTVLMAVAALNAFVLLAPPMLSTDIFSYQAYARIGSMYGGNPYLQGPHAIALDAIYPFIGSKWVGTPTAYGPVFTILGYLLAPLSIAASAFAYKAIAAVSSVALVAFVWNAARLRGLNPVRAAAFVGLNPLLLLYGVGGAHNDVLMLAVLAAGIYLVLSHRERAGGASMMLAAGIKLTAGVILPFALASERGGAGAGEPGQLRRRKMTVGALTVGAAIAALAFTEFGTGPLHMLATVRQGQREGDWHSLPGFITTKLGLVTIGHVTGVILALVFMITFAVLVRRVWLGRLDWIDGAGWATAVLLVTASAMFAWYVAWLLPLAALASDRRLWRTALVVTGVVLAIQLLGYFPYGGL